MAQLAELPGWAGPELAAAVMDALGHDVAAAASVLADMVAPEPMPTATAAAGAAETALDALPAAAGAAAGAAAAGGCRPACQQQGSPGGGSDYGSKRELEDDAPQADPYWHHRRHALLLSRRWQQAARGAAAAYAGGSRGEARHLASQAQWLRRKALSAYAEAVEWIETVNNQHKRCGGACAGLFGRRGN